MVVTVPPEPVRSLSDVKLFPGFASAAVLSCLSELFPSSTKNVRAAWSRAPQPLAYPRDMADPDGEIMANPASGEEVVQQIGGGMLTEELADLDRPDFGVASCILVKGAEERYATVRAHVPAVFTVENDRDEALPESWRQASAMAATFPMKSAGRDPGGRTALVVKADLVGHRMVAKNDQASSCLASRTFHRVGKAARDGERGPGYRGRPCSPVKEHPRISSSVAIHFDPLLGQERGSRPAADRALTEGHMPRGCSPKRRIWLSTARRTCALASSG